MGRGEFCSFILRIAPINISGVSSINQAKMGPMGYKTFCCFYSIDMFSFPEPVKGCVLNGTIIGVRELSSGIKCM